MPRNIAAAEVGISFHQIACSSLVVTDSNDSAWNVLHYQVKATLISGCTLCQCVGRGRCGLRSRGPHMSYTLPRYGNDILPCRESSSNMLKDWPLPSHAAGRPWHLYSILRTRRATPSFGGSLRRGVWLIRLDVVPATRLSKHDHNTLLHRPLRPIRYLLLLEIMEDVYAPGNQSRHMVGVTVRPICSYHQ
jgi:hypothetical protein